MKNVKELVSGFKSFVKEQGSLSVKPMIDQYNGDLNFYLQRRYTNQLNAPQYQGGGIGYVGNPTDACGGNVVLSFDDLRVLRDMLIEMELG